MNKNWILLLMAILLGVTCGMLHAKSVAEHKGQDKVQMQSTRYIEQTESHEMPLDVDVKVIHKANDPDIPDDIEEACHVYGEQYGISVEFLEALIWQESRFKADAVSDDGKCIGLCQINQGCHKKRMKKLGITDLTDTRQNIAVACDYLAELFEEHEDVAEVLYIYNGNTSGLEKYLETNEIKSAYVNEILERSSSLERKHGK